jgi:hypothetical protein
MATAKKAAKKKSRRTVMYSTGGKKLYAVRDASGKFKDIQQYSRAHAMDIKRGSSAEAKAVAKKAVKKAKTAAKKGGAKKAARKSTVKKVAKNAVKRVTTAKKAANRLVRRLRSAVAKVRAKL